MTGIGLKGRTGAVLDASSTDPVPDDGTGWRYWEIPVPDDGILPWWRDGSSAACAPQPCSASESPQETSWRATSSLWGRCSRGQEENENLHKRNPKRKGSRRSKPGNQRGFYTLMNGTGQFYFLRPAGVRDAAPKYGWKFTDIPLWAEGEAPQDDGPRQDEGDISSFTRNAFTSLIKMGNNRLWRLSCSDKPWRLHIPSLLSLFSWRLLVQHQTTEKARAHAVGRLLSSLGREVKTRERNKVTWHLLRSIPLNGVADPRTCASCSQNWLKTHTGIGIGIGSDIDIRYRHPTLAVSGCRYRMSISETDTDIWMSVSGTV